MLLISQFLISCATVNPQARIDEAARTEAQAGQVGDAIEATTQLPNQPVDCRRSERSGVEDGDRLDVALLKTDRALSRANSRVQRCAAWYDDLQQSREDETDGSN